MTNKFVYVPKTLMLRKGNKILRPMTEKDYVISGFVHMIPIIGQIVWFLDLFWYFKYGRKKIKVS